MKKTAYLRGSQPGILFNSECASHDSHFPPGRHFGAAEHVRNFHIFDRLFSHSYHTYNKPKTLLWDCKGNAFF